MHVDDYISLLRSLIRTPSFSRQENDTACIIADFLTSHGCSVERILNNVIARSSVWDDSKPVLLLNSHHDTVKPAQGYSRNPFSADIDGDFLYGLGSNDAGASVVALIAAFLHFRDASMPFNLLLAISAEEEVSGKNGIEAVLKNVHADMAIVGEPTSLQVALGERGLVVLDCEEHGISGHAARNEGVNAIYKALMDIDTLCSLQLERCSPLLGPVKFTVTQIEAGTQHNVVPDHCKFVVDIRTTDAYTNEQIVSIVRQKIQADVEPRSTRLRASAIDSAHPLVAAAKSIGLPMFVSPTMSDMAIMSFPSIKLGPGDSARSHSADEFVSISEIYKGISVYISLINALKNLLI